ncbi:fungal-specific transcription factor domain-containing protein [Exophiala viscosa]|uniref:Fungal-specific transcription factor domain-containing protein n=1 Tax=Exophiala viscosa TaxID=2486360 RepID=A0AAN6DWH6_9EURO|nr:fungal-specific transcription factor domain-containing protein [Exophiala viscosa]
MHAFLNLSPGQSETRYQNLSFHVAFVLNGMLSLAARFSTASYFGEKIPRERGDVFATRAKQMYRKFVPENHNLPRNLAYLQGCILLAFYSLSSIPESFGWLLTGDCIRLAYELELDKTDADIAKDLRPRFEDRITSEDWICREEKRRAWWSVWELDSFLSTLSNRPYAIDQRQMRVLLPAPDANWESGSPLSSSFLASDASQIWKSLQGCPNQDERAWFLVAKALMLQVHTAWRRQVTSSQAVADLDSALSCFSLLLPLEFQLDAGLITFDKGSFRQSNWIIATYILLQSSQTMMFLMHEKMAQAQHPPSSTGFDFSTPRNEKWLARCRHCTSNVCAAIQSWPPQYIPLCSPFMVVSLVGPSAMHLRRDVQSGDNPMEKEMLELAISHVAKYWQIGLLMSNVAKALKLAEPNQDPSVSLDTADVIKRITTILP